MVLCVCPNPSVGKYVWTGEFEFARANRAIKEENFPCGKEVVVSALKGLQEKPVVLGFG